MPKTTLVLIGGLLALAGCGSDGSSPPASAAPPAGEVATKVQTTTAKSAAGTKITARGSDFGRMLWGARRQAVYIFERDRPMRSRCYGACAEAWPPVFTRGKPIAGRGIRQSLLGTTRRRSGARQVTYAGKPLYYYAHEGPDQVLCHNVNLNGGFWWVVGPNGKRRP